MDAFSNAAAVARGVHSLNRHNAVRDLHSALESIDAALVHLNGDDNVSEEREALTGARSLVDSAMFDLQLEDI